MSVKTSSYVLSIVQREAGFSSRFAKRHRKTGK